MRRGHAGIRALVATAAAAVLFRLLYLWQLRDMPAFLEPVLDGAAHREWALGLLAGTWPGREAFFRAPGYVGWLAAELAVLGDDPARVAAFQLVLGAVTAVLTAALAGRLFGRGAAWIAGIGTAVYPVFAFFDAQLLAPVLAVPLTLAAALASLSALERGGTGRTAVAGLLWGTAAIVRAPLLVAGLLLPLFLWRRGGKGRWAAVGLAAAMALVPPLAVTVRNVAAGDPVFLASQGGLNFYLGNNARANGVAATFPDRPTALGYRMIGEARRIAEREKGRSLKSAAVSAYWRGRAVDDIAADPGRWLGLVIKKGVLFWSAREIPNNHDPVLFAEYIPLLRWLPGWSLWAPLGIVGFALAWRRREVLFAGGVVAAVAAGCVLFFVNARFRLPAAPFLVALGAGAAMELVRYAWAGRARQAGIAVALLAAAALFVRWNPYGIPREPWVVSYVLVAEAEAARREPVRALQWIERALEIEPGLYAARVAQIDLLRRAGRLQEARAVAEQGVRGLPQDPRLRNEYGALLDLTGDPTAGLEQIETALRLDPGFVPARVNRAVALARLGRAEAAREALRGLLAEGPEPEEAARAAGILRAIEDGSLGPAMLD